MKSLGFVLVILGLALLAVPAQAQNGGNTSFTLVGKPNAGDFAWFDNGGGNANPTLTVPANTDITFTLSSSDSTPHTFKVGGQTLVGTPFDDTAGAQTAKWKSGSGDTTYECTLHANMKGNIHIAGSSSTTTPSKSPGTQLVGVTLAMAGAALLVARRVQ